MLSPDRDAVQIKVRARIPVLRRTSMTKPFRVLEWAFQVPLFFQGSAGQASDNLGGTQSLPSAYKLKANQSFGKAYPEEIPQAVLNAVLLLIENKM